MDQIGFTIKRELTIVGALTYETVSFEHIVANEKEIAIFKIREKIKLAWSLSYW